MSMKKKDYKLGIWAVSFIVVGMLFVVFIFSGKFSLNDVTGATTFDEIKIKAVNYVHEEKGDVDVEVSGVRAKNNGYEVILKINKEDYVYVLERNNEFLRKL